MATPLEAAATLDDGDGSVDTVQIVRPLPRRLGRFVPEGAAPLGVDLARAELAVAELLAALGVDLGDESLLETPARVAKAYAEFLTPRPFDLTTFSNDEGYDELVVTKDIPFHSLCEHHLLPFVGVVHIGYLPADRILGLSKLARVVEHFSQRLQVQERLTSQVAHWLNDHLAPKGVGVVLEAEHLCMTLRGAQATGARTMTSSLHGLVRHDERTRAEPSRVSCTPSLLGRMARCHTDTTTRPG